MKRTMFTRLTLSAVQKKAAASRTYLVRFIAAGDVRAQGNEKSPITLPPEPLITAESIGMFLGKACFINHAENGATPRLEKLVGMTTDSWWSEDANAIEGTIRLYGTEESNQLEHLLDEVLQDQQNGHPIPDIGLSLVFWGMWKNDDRGGEQRKITRITHIESIDFVFEPAAGGLILEKLNSRTQTAKQQELGEKNMKEEKIKKDKKKEETWEQAIHKASASSIVDLVENLPDATRAKLKKQGFSEPQALNKAIADERAYIAALVEEKVVDFGEQSASPRSAHIQLGMTGFDSLKLAASALVAGERPQNGVRPLSGVRELYTLLSGDYEMTGIFQSERVQFASVNSSTMPQLLAEAMNKRVINLFQNYPRWWEKLVRVEDFTNLNTVRWISLGGIGELPTVNEGAAYAELTWSDQQESTDFTKKGGYLGITMEAIDKDDTRKLQAAPRALAQAAWLSLSKATSSIFTANSGVGPNMSDGLALFHATHNNLDAQALSHATFASTVTAMRKQTELQSGEPLGFLTAAKYLLVPPDLELTALQVMATDNAPGSSNFNANPFASGSTLDARLASARERVIVVDMWTDQNNWAAIADPQLYPTIGLGFRYGRTPEIYSVASPTSGLMFTNDTMPVKVRFVFACAPMDWRGLFKQNPV